MELYQFTQEQLTKELNKGKELYLDALGKEGILTKEKMDEMATYSIVLAKKSMLGSLWNKLFKKNDEPRYFIVKILEQWDDVE